MFGSIAALWGVIGMVLIFSSAVYRLAPMAFELPFAELSFGHWMALLSCLAFMGFAEGYRGFQQNFSPRAAARARYLRDNPTLIRLLLAPLFCMGFFHTTKKRKIVSYSLTAFIICLVILVHSIPQPWRGIIDAGVVLGLSWGLVSLLIFSIQALTQPDFAFSPETPYRPEKADSLPQ